MKRFIITTGCLFRKDIKDTLRNFNMTIMLLMPAAFALIFRFLTAVHLEPQYILMLCTVMCICMVSLSFLATIIAEEKEKNTLRTLMLAGVSATEFITSKILVTWMLMQMVNVFVFLTTGYSVAKLPVFFLLTTLGSLSLLLIGAVIGIISRDQMSTSVLSMPVMMLLLLPSTLGMMSPLFGKLAMISPVEWLMKLFLLWDGGGSLISSEGLKGFGVIAAWIVLGLVLYNIGFRKQRLDVSER